MRYLIIGNSAAATGAVEGIRTVDTDSEITVIARENYPTYSRPLISYYLSGKVSKENMYFRPPSFYNQYHVNCYLGEEVTELSPDKKTVHIEPQGIDIQYDKLLIATGGTPLLPACFVGEYDNLFHFHKWDDVEKINAFINRKMEIVVVGGGLIGLKAAESLWMRGQEVTVVEAGPYLLNSILDEYAAGIVSNRFQSRGIKVVLSNPVARVVGNRNIRDLILQDGTRLNCDMVVMAAGVRPNTGWLANTEINMQDGILVDNYLQTSVPDVYAAGDVIRVYDEISSSYKLIPIWPHAYKQGKIAGLNMTGHKAIYLNEPAFNSIPLLGLNIATAGLSSDTDEQVEIITKSNSEWIYNKLVFRNDTLVGFIFTGDISRCGIYRLLIGKKINVADFKERLGEPGFGIIDLPLEYRSFQ